MVQIHGKAHNLVRKLRMEYDVVLNDVDVLLMPTLPFVAKTLLVRPPPSPPLVMLIHFVMSFQPTDAPLQEHLKVYTGLVRLQQSSYSQDVRLTSPV